MVCSSGCWSTIPGCNYRWTPRLSAGLTQPRWLGSLSLVHTACVLALCDCAWPCARAPLCSGLARAASMSITPTLLSAISLLIPMASAFRPVARVLANTSMTTCAMLGNMSFVMPDDMSQRNITTSDGPHRADLVAISPVGTVFALDVHVTAPTSLCSCQGCPQPHSPSWPSARWPHLCACHGALLSCLSTAGGGGGLLHRALHDTAARALSSLAVTWGMRFARVTREATAGLAQAFALGSYCDVASWILDGRSKKVKES